MSVVVPAGVEAPEPSLEVVKVARLEISPVPQVAELVWLKMWTVKVPPLPARSVGPHVRVRGAPVMVQAGAGGVWESTLHDRRVLVGTTSVMVKPWASPAPVL